MDHLRLMYSFCYYKIPCLIKNKSIRDIKKSRLTIRILNHPLKLWNKMSIFVSELDAYGNMVSVLRAQGPYSGEKQKLLQELTKVLHISNERHRAEIRRAVNDEKLTTIAEQ